MLSFIHNQFKQGYWKSSFNQLLPFIKNQKGILMISCEGLKQEKESTYSSCVCGYSSDNEHEYKADNEL